MLHCVNPEVARLTFWLFAGNAAVLGLGIAFEPLAASAINRLPEWLNCACAIIILMVDQIANSSSGVMFWLPWWHIWTRVW